MHVNGGEVGDLLFPKHILVMYMMDVYGRSFHLIQLDDS